MHRDSELAREMRLSHIYERESRQQFMQEVENARREAKSSLPKIRKVAAMTSQSSTVNPDHKGGYTAEGKVRLNELDRLRVVEYKKEMTKSGTTAEKEEWAKVN